MANEKNVKETINFNFRSKFKKLLTEDIKSSDILDAFAKFCSLGPDTVINLLWYLTYSEDSAVITFNSLGLDFECIPAIQLRNELRHQYNMIHPGFLTIELTSQEVREAYETLKTKTDLIVSNVVYHHCCSKMFLAEDEIARIIYLLSSNDEKNFFGGIRSLGFTKTESIYLKPFYEEIGNLFKALCDANQQDSTNLPFKDVQQLITVTSTESFEEDQAKVSMENQAETSVKDQVKVSVKDAELPVDNSHEDAEQDSVTPLSTTSFRQLTAVAILANADTFTSFSKGNDFNSLTSLVAAGFDLNQVMSKKEEISNFLDAVAALN